MATVFLSYSSEQGEAATRIELSLKGDGHAVFRDRSALPPGESFDARIRLAIDESDLFIFATAVASRRPRGHDGGPRRARRRLHGRELAAPGAFTRAHRGAAVALDGDIRYRPKT